MIEKSERKSSRIRRLLDRLAELLKKSTRPAALACLVQTMKTEENEKRKALQ